MERNRLNSRKNLKILTSFSGKANGKQFDEEHLKKNSSSIPFETIEDSNNRIFNKKTFLLSNSYLNQYLFAAKKMPDRKRRHSSLNVEREMLKQQKKKNRNIKSFGKKTTKLKWTMNAKVSLI